eukprot:6212138-Pleurochrysis_carterae.AAC.1
MPFQHVHITYTGLDPEMQETLSDRQVNQVGIRIVCARVRRKSNFSHRTYSELCETPKVGA